jgi:Mrp family chromosome partitioning ATPase
MPTAFPSAPWDNRRVRVVVITGPPGAGKSSVATALHDALGDRGVANALIEVDELERSYPPVPLDHVVEHVRVLADSYRSLPRDLLLVTATLEDDMYAARLLAALPSGDRFVVRLEATPATLQARIRDREPAGWSGLDQLLASAARLAATMPRLYGVDLVLSTEGTSAEAVAERCLPVVWPS